RRYIALAKERAQLEETVTCWRARRRVADDVEQHRELLREKDEELRELAKNELPALEARLAELDATLRRLLLPKDPNDERSTVLEIRAGTGGDAASLFSAVRVTHLPTALVVTCQDEKSQHKNKAKALKILRARLLERARQEQQSEIAANRRAMVGSGDRSEKIRTYNFPQNRVTDHRVNL